MRWTPEGWASTSLLHEMVPDDAELLAAARTSGKSPASLGAMRDRLRSWCALMPGAFEPPTAGLMEKVKRVGKNWVSSDAPLGTPEDTGDDSMQCVSAGHSSHPSTTHSATEDVFAFLDLHIS